MPVTPLSLVEHGIRLDYCSMITTVGDPGAVAAQELRIELFPADEETGRRHLARKGVGS